SRAPSWNRSHTIKPSKAVTSGRWTSMGRSQSAPTNSRGAKQRTSAPPPGISSSSMRPTAFAMSTSLRMSSRTPSSRRSPRNRNWLLTATPLQNSLLELFGLVSFIDEYTFGDLKSFREQFANAAPDRVFNLLRERLRPICHRTLRRQVTTYVPYTRRYPIVEEFTPEDGEDKLYDLVSEYLRRDNLQALPASQRSLMTLVLRKLLASSTFAIAGALTSISRRLQSKLDDDAALGSAEEDLAEDYEALDETEDEW